MLLYPTVSKHVDESFNIQRHDVHEDLHRVFESRLARYKGRFVEPDRRLETRGTPSDALLEITAPTNPGEGRSDSGEGLRRGSGRFAAGYHGSSTSVEVAEDETEPD